MFARDSDLLGYEPLVFVDVPYAGQKKRRVTDGAVDGSTLSSATGGLAALEAGDVVVIAPPGMRGVAHAVASVTDDHALELATAPAALGAATGLVVEARTFAPQLEMAGRELLRLAGLEGLAEADALARVRSVERMKRLEALGALSRAYGSALSIGGENTLMREKAAQYERRYRAALASARIVIDADETGSTQMVWAPGAAALTRD